MSLVERFREVFAPRDHQQVAKRNLVALAVIDNRDGIIRQIKSSYKAGGLIYVSLRRTKVWSRSKNKTVLSIMLSLHSSSVRQGVLQVGGAENHIASYELRYLPAVGSMIGGKILDPIRQAPLLELACQLEEGIQSVVDEHARCPDRVDYPRFFAAYTDVEPIEEQLGGRFTYYPEVEINSKVVKLALETAREGAHPHYPLPATRSPGGLITSIHRTTDFVLIGYDGNSDNPNDVQELPGSAVLFPGIRAGTDVAPGAVVADFLPRKLYKSLDHLRGVFDKKRPGLVDWFMREVVHSRDQLVNGVLYRPLPLCGELNNSAAVYEDPAPTLDPDGYSRIMVTTQASAAGLVHRSPNLLVDLVSIGGHYRSMFLGN